jgi:hypothetical protein
VFCPPPFRQFASIGDEIAYATRCIKAWHERGDLLVDIAVICMEPDHGKRIAHQLQALYSIPICSWLSSNSWSMTGTTTRVNLRHPIDS